MQVPLRFIGLIAAAALAQASCRQNDEADDASELLSRVREDDYRTWTRAPGYASRAPAGSPHSDQVEIFVNGIVEGALASPGAAVWPEGSIIVKDGYADDGVLELVAIMEKRATGWFWAEYDGASGEPLYSGSPDICVDCHGSGDDFVRAFGFP